MSNTYKRFVQSVIGLSVLMIVLGVLETQFNVRIWDEVKSIATMPLEMINRQDIASQPMPVSQDESHLSGVQESCCESVPQSETSLSQDSDLERYQQYERIYWQDDFDDATSGWDPYFEIVGEVPVYGDKSSQGTIRYVTSNAKAWNGYDGGNYSFALPTSPLSSVGTRVGGFVTPYLWDFNTSRPLPDYPYQVDVTAETQVGSQALVVLDFAGDINNVSAGQGILVNIPMKHDVYAISDGFESIAVWEFMDNRVWSLGCHPAGLDEPRLGIASPQLMASFIVDNNQLIIRVFNDDVAVFSVKCARVHTGDATATRVLGIGARVNDVSIPIPFTGLLRYQKIIVAQPNTEAVYGTDVVVQNEQPVLYGEICALWEDTGKYSNLDQWLSLIDDTCGAFGGPNTMHQRVTWPTQANMFGAWQCGSDQQFANFVIRPEQDYAIIEIAGLEYAVFAVDRLRSEDIGYRFIIDFVPDGYIEGYEQRNPIAQIGDYVTNDAANDFSYYITYTNDTLLLSWINTSCNRIN